MKKIQRRTISLILVAVIAAAMVGCTGVNNDISNSEKTNIVDKELGAESTVTYKEESLNEIGKAMLGESRFVFNGSEVVITEPINYAYTGFAGTYDFGEKVTRAVICIH